MPTDEAVLRPAGREDLTDCAAFLARLLRLDAAALVRLQPAGDQMSIWGQPLGVVVRREIRAGLNVSDRTVSAAELLAALGPLATGPTQLPAARDAAWRTTLPPRAGWSVLDAIPVGVLRGLADRAGQVVQGARDPTLAGEALLDQEALRVSHGGEEVVLAIRLIVVLIKTGLLGAGGQSADLVRVAATPAWARVAARHGTVYQRRSGLGLSLG